MAFAPRHRTPAILVLVVLSIPMLAGCAAPGDSPPGTDPGTDPPVEPAPNPPDEPGQPQPLFDSSKAHALALAQLYDDPTNLSGPRYRIPGSTTTDTVASELIEAFKDAVAGTSATVTQVDFTGVDYYQLNHRPVAPWVCPEDDPARTRVNDITFHNIVVRTDPDQVGLIIGAHYDSKRHADSRQDPAHAGQPILGGDDGAASTATVVELARAFAKSDPGIPRTYVLFDGEDGFASDDCHPLAGSLHYAQSLNDTEVASATGMILLDMIGNVSATFQHEGNSRSYRTHNQTIDSSWLGDLIWATADGMGVGAFSPSRTSAVADDHLPFLERGIPSVDIIRFDGGFAPYWHSTRDDHTSFQREGIDQVGRVVERSVHRLGEALRATNAAQVA